MTRFSNPHQKIPVHYVEKKDMSRGLVLYHSNSGTFGTDFSISGTDTSVVLEQMYPAKTIEIGYIDKNIRDFQRDINVSNLPFKAVALNEALNLDTGELVTNTSTPNYEGGYFIDLKRHVVRYQEETRIRIDGVSDSIRTAPWYPRIDIGTISKSHGGKNYIFSVPEYENQLWHPIYGRPYKPGADKGLFSDRKKISLKDKPLYYRDSNIDISVDGGVPLYDMIEDVDEQNGFIYLKEELPQNSEVFVEYTYKDHSYVYDKINLNPAIEQNPGIAGRYVLIYLKPTEVHPDGISRSKSIHHKVANNLLDAIVSLPYENEPILILGGYHIRQTNTVEDSNILDTRTRGGGIKDTEYSSSLEKNKNTYSVTDVGFADGVPYPGSSVIVAEIPEEVKDVMTVAEIKRRISKHVTLGVDTLLEFE